MEGLRIVNILQCNIANVEKSIAVRFAVMNYFQHVVAFKKDASRPECIRSNVMIHVFGPSSRSDPPETYE